MGGFMRGVLLRGPHQMRLEEVPRPAPRPDQVLVRVRYSACCATDFDLIDGTMPDQAKYPIILGHEWSGQVVEAPPEHAALVGMDIVADNLVTCGTCPACVGGRPNLCRKMDELGFSLNGSHAEYLVTLAQSVRVLPSGLSPKAAALAEPVGVALYGARRARVGLGDRVVVLGAGPIGLFSMQVCRAAGAAEVWQADLRPERRALAERLGATGTLDVTHEDLTAALARAGVVPDVVLECSGSPSAFAAALRAVRPGGRVGVLGYYSDERVEIRPSDIMMRDLEVIGAVCPTGTWEAAIELLATGRVDTDALITHVLPLERFDEAYRLARGGPGVIKVVLEI
jgi:2-desacetyl-2-hydroxyethyl bacteriochlorophyllide A dehydrogenase